MTTIANRRSTDGSHFYYPDGTPCYEVPYADPRKGNRPTTLADARKLNLLPSVTTILKVLHKQALVDWLIEQAVLAVLTTPRQPGEADDAFTYRVLHTEKVQDQESAAARDRGTEIHSALEAMFKGEPIAPDLTPWVEPVYREVAKRGELVACEQIVVGQGYAGKVDLQLRHTDGTLWLYDYKTTRKLPDKAAWPEHRLQLAAYGVATGRTPWRAANVYISTVEPGKFVILEHENEQETFENGFLPLLKHWQWATGYRP